MANNCLIRVTLGAASGIPADAVVNTFAFKDPTGTVEDLIHDSINALITFYNDMTDPGLPDTTKVCGLLASSLSRAPNECLMEGYDLGDPISLPLGSPVETQPWTLAELGDDEIVGEAAIALSFHASLAGLSEEVGSTRPRARRRGRVFLGPFRQSLATEVDGAERRRPNQFTIDTLVSAANRLMDTAGIDWSVWSRTDNVLREVVGGYVDDAFDTIRSRGPAATMRTTWGS